MIVVVLVYIVVDLFVSCYIHHFRLEMHMIYHVISWNDHVLDFFHVLMLMIGEKLTKISRRGKGNCGPAIHPQHHLTESVWISRARTPTTL